MRPLCLRCRRPQSTCYCAHLPQLETRTRVVFLQHPREARVAIGTARMAHLSLPNSELYQGVDFSDLERLQQLAKEPSKVAVLFPGEGAVAPESLRGAPPEVLIVIDGTWNQAKKVVARNPLLSQLPRVGFTPRRPSNYRIRSEPAEHCVSTIEAVVETLGAMEGDFPRFDTMLKAFEHMVDTQLRYTEDSDAPPRRRLRRAPPRVLPQLQALRDARERLVLLYAEANAHPEGAGLEPELMHLTARRLSSGETFEAVLAPRLPLAPSTPLHLDLAEARLRAGEALQPALERWSHFLRPDDVLAAWGPFSLQLLLREGAGPRELIDLRRLYTLVHKQRAGGVEDAARRSAPVPEAPWTGGRAGRRIVATETVAQTLLGSQQETQAPAA
ncbi:tRNA-uridine aminocarboxypropyltransferase [Aggregicoccus sp. 17bor-14]|uniref:tRNA-uridine aminocarboxypropyltransferase n=1 Tax=Myxococcaceae TaxID=31 RepID=UPI00351A6890